MSARNLILTAFALTGFVSTSSGQMLPRWKFEKGQVYDVERIATQKQTVELQGKPLIQIRQSTWQVRLEVNDKQGDDFIVQARLTKVEHLVEAERLVDAKLAEKMRDSEFTLRVTTTGRIVELKGYEAFLMRLAGTDKARAKALRATFPESTVRESLADLFGPLPEKAGWQREHLEAIPHFGSLRSIATYTSDGDRFAYTIQTKYEVPKDEPTILFRIVKGSIDREKSHGSIRFDGAAGRLREHDRTLQLHGTLTIDAMDRMCTLAFTSEQTVRVRVK